MFRQRHFELKTDLRVVLETYNFTGESYVDKDGMALMMDDNVIVFVPMHNVEYVEIYREEM